jgi:transposase-like protein
MGTKPKRRNLSSEFKSKVALDAIKEQNSLEELSKKHEVHPVQISTWKNEVISNVRIIFDTSSFNFKAAPYSNETFLSLSPYHLSFHLYNDLP